MDMVIVRIKPESIRENPNAGRTHFHLTPMKQISFKLRGELPKNLSDAVVVTGQSINFVDPDESFVEGVLLDDTQIEKLVELKADISIEQPFQTINHFPEPGHFYEYEDPLVECSHCHSKIAVSEIKEDYVFDGEDEQPVDECPVCHNRNTFPERKYESLSEILRM
jgi:hypothetical protein